MKKVFSLLLACLFFVNVFAYNGLLSGTEELKIVKTEWFDIIYPETAEGGASVLYDNADRIYKEVTAQYGLEPEYRFVVTITDKLDNYNAFFAPIPYNRIVLFHTSTAKIDDLSGGFSQGFLQTFYHELTHAVTFNMKNGFWNGVTNIFGDPMVLGYLFPSHGFAEGAAVASESRNGVDGRLNDEYAKHITKQAKIEDCFPTYYDLRGANSSTTFSLSYYFHGAFHAYLQEKYGMEKYTEWWNRVINLRSTGEGLSFRAAYGKKLRNEWNEFAKSYEVPEVEKNPVENKVVADFFDPASGQLSIMNNSGARFGEVYKCDTGIYYSVDFLKDRYSRRIYFVPNEQIFGAVAGAGGAGGQNGGAGASAAGAAGGQTVKIKPEYVFTHQLAEDFTVSKDGRFIVISGATTSTANMQSRIRIYDNNYKRFYDIKDQRLKNGSVIKSGNEYYLVAHRFKSPDNVLVIRKIQFENNNIEGKIIGLEKPYEEEQPLNHFVCNFIELNNGSFAYIRKAYSDFIITVSDINGNIQAEYPLPEGVKIRQLSSSNNGSELYFSYAKKGTMPRLGILNLETASFTLSNKDISGGIFSPVVVGERPDDGEAGATGAAANPAARPSAYKFIYIGTFFNENRLLTFDSNSPILADSDVISLGTSATAKENFVNKEKTVFTDISTVSEPYKRFKNIHQGWLLPLSLYSSNMIGENYGQSSISQMLPIGLTYATMNPWNGGNASDDLFIITAGWSPLTNSFGIETILNQGTGTSAFLSSLDLKSEFDKNGWKQSGGNLTLGSGFNFGKVSMFKIQNNITITGGKQNDLNSSSTSIFESYAPTSDNVAFNITELLQFQYSALTSTGPGRWEQAGVSVGATTGYVYDTVLGRLLVLNPFININIPKLIPITQKQGLTYNLPLKLNFSLMPPSSSFGMTGASIKNARSSVLDFNAETVLFGIDIQKAIPYLDGIFVNELYVTAGYNSSLATYKGYKKDFFQMPYMFEYFENISNGKTKYLDSVYMDFVMKLTPNFGILANPVVALNLNIYGRVSYSINVMPEDKSKFSFTFGLRSDF